MDNFPKKQRKEKGRLKLLVPVDLSLTKRLKSRTIRIHGLPYANQPNKMGKENQERIDDSKKSGNQLMSPRTIGGVPTT